MVYYQWNKEKNEQLKQKRNISFERITTQIENGKLLDIVDHPNKENYPNQKMVFV